MKIYLSLTADDTFVMKLTQQSLVPFPCITSSAVIPSVTFVFLVILKRVKLVKSPVLVMRFSWYPPIFHIIRLAIMQIIFLPQTSIGKRKPIFIYHPVTTIITSLFFTDNKNIRTRIAKTNKLQILLSILTELIHNILISLYIPFYI